MPSGAQNLTVDAVALEVHERAGTLRAHGVREVAEAREIVPFAGIEDDPNGDAATLSLV